MSAIYPKCEDEFYHDGSCPSCTIKLMEDEIQILIKALRLSTHCTLAFRDKDYDKVKKLDNEIVAMNSEIFDIIKRRMKDDA